jgi:hypothetical protein
MVYYLDDVIIVLSFPCFRIHLKETHGKYKQYFIALNIHVMFSISIVDFLRTHKNTTFWLRKS